MPAPRDSINRWVVVVKRIKQLAAAHARRDPPSTLVPAVLEVLRWADDIPVLKQNTASQLMFSIKVPSKLLAAYTRSHSSNNPSSNGNRPATASRSSSSSSNTGAPIIGMAVILLLTRFLKAVFGQALWQSDSNEERRLKAEAERQLRQAGLHEHFPAIVAAAVAAAAAAAEGVAATQLEHMQQLAGSVPADDKAVAAAADTESDAATAAATSHLGQQCIIALWQLLGTLNFCMNPDAWVAFVQPFTVLLLQLFLGFMQAISRQCEQQQAQDPGADTRRLLRWAFDIVTNRLCEGMRHMDEAHQQNQKVLVQKYFPLLQSPYCMQACTLLTVLAAYAMLLHYQPLESLVDDAATSSSSSALDELERASHPLAAHAWSLARSRQHLLPASHGELLQLMGVSRAGAIWAAAQLNSSTDFIPTIRGLLHAIEELYEVKWIVAGRQVIASLEAAAAALAAAANAATPPAFGAAAAAAAGEALQQCQLLQNCCAHGAPREHALLGLLPSVLLHWAFETAADHPGFADIFTLATAASRTAFDASACQTLQQGLLKIAGDGLQQQQQPLLLQEQQAERQQQQQQQQPVQPLPSDPSDRQSYAAKQIGLTMQVLSKLLAEVISLSSAQTNGSSSRNSATSLQAHTNNIHAVLTLLTPLLRHPFCSTCVEHNQLRIAHLPLAAGACHWRSSAGPIWAQHSTQLFTLLEEYVRLDLPDITPSQVCSISALCKPPGLGFDAGANSLFTAAAEAGPGSARQQQYCSLMCSLLKYVGRLQGQQQHQMLVEEVRLLVAHTSLMLTARNLLEPADQHGSSTGVSGGSSSTGSSSSGGGTSSCSSGSSGGGSSGSSSSNTSASTTTTSSSSHAHHSAGVACLPWLVLFGRCCTQWVEQHAAEPDEAQLQQQQQGPLPRVKGGIIQDMQQSSHNTLLNGLSNLNNFRGSGDKSNTSNNSLDVFKSTIEYKGVFMPLLAAWGHLLGSSLVAGGLAGVLQAEGYQDLLSALTQSVMPVYDPVQQALSKAAALPAEETGRSELRATVVAEDNRLSCDVPVQVAEDWGLVLTSIAIGGACNNPSCSNMAETSELELVKGSARTCAGCRTARYCSSNCQKQHWQQH